MEEKGAGGNVSILRARRYRPVRKGNAAKAQSNVGGSGSATIRSMLVVAGLSMKSKVKPEGAEPMARVAREPVKEVL